MFRCYVSFTEGTHNRSLGTVWLSWCSSSYVRFLPGVFHPFHSPPPIRSPFQKVGRVSHWPHIQSVGLEEFSQRGDNFAKMMVENASVYSERNLPTSCPLIRIFCSRISLRNNIPIEKTCHYGNGAISLDFWYGECQKWIQICIWAPGPIFIPGFLHRSPAPVWMELELQSLSIECQMFLNAQRRCWSPKRDLLQLYKQTSTSSKQVPTHFPLLSAKARASVARLILTGLAMQAKEKKKWDKESEDFGPFVFNDSMTWSSPPGLLHL